MNRAIQVVIIGVLLAIPWMVLAAGMEAGVLRGAIVGLCYGSVGLFIPRT